MLSQALLSESVSSAPLVTWYTAVTHSSTIFSVDEDEDDDADADWVEDDDDGADVDDENGNDEEDDDDADDDDDDDDDEDDNDDDDDDDEDDDDDNDNDDDEDDVAVVDDVFSVEEIVLFWTCHFHRWELCTASIIWLWGVPRSWNSTRIK